MREIGVRELKRSLSETLRAVGRGEQVRVTVRNKAVADILPAGAVAGTDQLRALVAEGRVVPAARSRPSRAPKPVQVTGSASALVLAEREGGR